MPSGIWPLASEHRPFVQDDAGHWFLVDTGAPRTLVVSDLAGHPPGTFAEEELAEWSVLGLRDIPSVIVTDTAAPIDAPGPAGGVLGVDLLAQAPVIALDPRGRRLAINATSDILDNVLPGTKQRFELLGAGSTCLEDGACYRFASNRQVIPVVVEGEATWAIIDSGADFAIVASSLVGRLPARSDRRTVVRPWGITFTRLYEIVVGTQHASNVIVTKRDNEQLFVKLRVDTQREIEVILGQSFLQRYVSEINFADNWLRLHPYREKVEHYAGRFTGIGATLEASDGCFVVVDVVRQSDAEQKGLQPGDCIVAIDELDPDTVSIDSVIIYFISLDAGDTVEVKVHDGADSKTLSIQIEDQLPPMR